MIKEEITETSISNKKKLVSDSISDFAGTILCKYYERLVELN